MKERLCSVPFENNYFCPPDFSILNNHVKVYYFLKLDKKLSYYSSGKQSKSLETAETEGITGWHGAFLERTKQLIIVCIVRILVRGAARHRDAGGGTEQQRWCKLDTPVVV